MMAVAPRASAGACPQSGMAFGAEAGVRLTDAEFDAIRRFIHREAGIALTPAKKTLVAGRLLRRLGVVGAKSYGDYLACIESTVADSERQVAIDLLTTNETYFWREARHFELAATLCGEAAAQRREFAVWSAACSSGEEVYTLAMACDQVWQGGHWSVLGSDISERVLKAARRGVYPMDRAAQLPEAMLRRYCMKGSGPYEGHLLIGRALRDRVRFESVNLIETLPAMPTFDMIFLRNVMIYFDAATKEGVVRRLIAHLKPGGTICVGLAESLHGVVDGLKSIGPGAYRRESV